MSEPNPFAALVQNEEKIATTSADPLKTIKTKKQETVNSLNGILEKIFAFTLNEDVAIEKGYMFLGGEQGCLGNNELNFDVLSYCLFERLFSCNKDNPLRLRTNKKGIEVHSTEYHVILYLYICYKLYIEQTENLSKIGNHSFIRDEILRNVATAYIHPDIYFEQDLYQQLIDILMDEKCYAQEFFRDVCHAIVNHEESDEFTLKMVFERIISLLNEDVSKTTLLTFDIRVFVVLKALTMEEEFAVIFMDCNLPKKVDSGVSYVSTLLGGLINTCILPRTPRSGFEHFENMQSQVTIETTENLLWGRSRIIVEEIHLLTISLLKKGPIVKEKVLTWFGQCLQKNFSRVKLWNSYISHNLFPEHYNSAPDGFMIQLGNIFARLCLPFCKDKKITKVDPTYCAVTNDLLKTKNIHLPDMSGETFLLSDDQHDDNKDHKLLADSYNFSTECFFFAHKTIHLGFGVAVERTVRMNQELGRIERAFNDARSQATNSSIINTLKDELTREMSKFLSYKVQLSEPDMLNSMFDLMSSTSYWLCQVVMQEGICEKKSFAPQHEMPVSFPPPRGEYKTLKCIPEFIIGNIISFIVFIMRYTPKTFEQQGYEKMEPILTFILLFMGNHGLVRNPHLRAQLAEALEALLPVHKEEFGPKNDILNFQRTMLLQNYKFKNQVVKSLLEVFVGIEMTGQSVEFEQKFNYRRPMYAIMEYLWNKEDYQHYFQQLAEEAEQKMDTVSAPIFLRFINLLMNDAVFLLDESLNNMAKLREMQISRDSGEWDKLPTRERTENLQTLHRTGMVARFDNILGRDTINALVNLTSKITIVFTHSTMVDRIAAMLNYFLLNLVGPNKKNFKVKDQKDYHFDPAETVLKICKIYINLKDNDSFCLAISQDGRSYSPNLFSFAESVLIRIGGSGLIQEIRELSEKVARKAEEYQTNEEAVAEAPEHFLDPIMSTLMTDPVILPSSKQVVDRTTIARHLLSDQSDPFNRSPLSMDQIIPHKELADEIKQWISERRNT
ncbi:hypothetical protein WA026_016380 [Henosepilachna vigintioctopunctata]|uniref:Ubiquitin conjugation factor E4 A n=1 Tax=Henosepilachna vigintioctopunctata TaxID=420089 RepID=A0AAW1UM14_9CUCU